MRANIPVKAVIRSLTQFVDFVERLIRTIPAANAVERNR
jgi:hypothetical protein